MSTQAKRVSFPKLMGLLAAVWAVAVGPARAAQPDLFVSSYFTDNVLRYDGKTGAFVDTFASGGGLDRPAGLAFGPDNNLYVSSGTTEQQHVHSAGAVRVRPVRRA